MGYISPFNLRHHLFRAVLAPLEGYLSFKLNVKIYTVSYKFITELYPKGTSIDFPKNEMGTISVMPSSTFINRKPFSYFNGTVGKGVG